VSTAAVILAAGGGTRYLGDTPKPLALLRGRPLVQWAVDAALAAGIAPVAVVAGPDHAAVWHALPDAVVRLRNRDWERGIGTSLATAVAWAEDDARADAVCIALADQPLLGPESWRRVAHAATAPEQPLAVATYGGRRGHPVRIAASLFPDARRLDGDEGARILMRAHGVLEVPCDGTGSPDDVDTVEDLAALETRLGPST